MSTGAFSVVCTYWNSEPYDAAPTHWQLWQWVTRWHAVMTVDLWRRYGIYRWCGGLCVTASLCASHIYIYIDTNMYLQVRWFLTKNSQLYRTWSHACYWIDYGIFLLFIISMNSVDTPRRVRVAIYSYLCYIGIAATVSPRNVPVWLISKITRAESGLFLMWASVCSWFLCGWGELATLQFEDRQWLGLSVWNAIGLGCWSGRPRWFESGAWPSKLTRELTWWGSSIIAWIWCLFRIRLELCVE